MTAVTSTVLLTLVSRSLVSLSPTSPVPRLCPAADTMLLLPAVAPAPALVGLGPTSLLPAVRPTVAAATFLALLSALER
jgi:hypothetical protein